MASGTIYKRETPSGASSWTAHATWTEGGKRRQRKRSFRTKKEAQAALTELLAAHQTGTFVAPDRTTVRQFFDPWIDGLINQGRKPSTLQGYRAMIRTHVLPTLGDVALQDLRATDLDVVYAEMRRNGSALATVHHVHAVVHKMLNDAERKGIVIRNVARLADAPSLTAARNRGPEMRVWTPAELSKFLNFIEGNRNEVMVRVLALTGVRRSELCGLRWQDIDLDRHRLTVNQAVTVIDGDEHIDSPKSRRSHRVVDLDAETAALLKRHRTTQLEMYLRLGATASASDRVFTNEIGDPIRPNSVGQAFARLVKESGIPLIRLHDLRHTHASHLLLAGINIKVVSERLGHSSVSFTLDTYAHVMPSRHARRSSSTKPA